MKVLIIILSILGIHHIGYSQTNTFPSSGIAGIGTVSTITALEVKGSPIANWVLSALNTDSKSIRCILVMGTEVLQIMVCT